MAERIITKEEIKNLYQTQGRDGYQKWRKAPCFSYGDISHTLFPRKK